MILSMQEQRSFTIYQDHVTKTMNHESMNSARVECNGPPEGQDVVLGRGGFSYSHSGNRLFRRLVQHNHELYHSSTEARHRKAVSFSIVSAIRRKGGRFLRKKRGKILGWETVSEKEACIKTAQALRDANVRASQSSGSERKQPPSICSNSIDDAVPCQSQGGETPNRDYPSPTLWQQPQKGEGLSEDHDEIDAETLDALVRSLAASEKDQSPESSSQPASRSSFRLSFCTGAFPLLPHNAFTMEEELFSGIADSSVGKFKRCWSSITSVSLVESIFVSDFDEDEKL